ncbi:MAG TPA: oligosaccharide flippase family protein [Terriglobia bacterium]|nr:oligosaccharide flippase family protein [Terriglobia bacterium]
MSAILQVFPRRLFLNTAAIFGGEAVARCATLLMAIIIARRFGPIALGEYGYALALASVLLLIPDFGTHLFAVRELSTCPGELPAIFWNVHWLKVLITGLLVVFIVLGGRRLIPDPGRCLLFYLLAARVLFQTYSQASMAVFKAFERMHFVAFQQSINSCVVVGWAAAALALHANLLTIVAALIAGQAAETFLGWHFIRAKFSPGRLARWDCAHLLTIAISSFPIGITAMFQALDLRLDVLVLGHYVSNQILGQFQAAAWFPVGIFLVTSLLMTVLFPRLSRLFQGGSTQGSAYVMGLLKNGLLAATLGALVLWIGAPALVVWIFGEALAPAAPTLRLLAPMAPLVFLNTVLFYVFIAARRRRVYMGALGLGVALGLGLSLFLTPHFGVRGCALADVVREFAMCTFYLYFLVKENHARVAGLDVLKILVPATLLVTLGDVAASSPAYSGQWSGAWILLVLMGTLVTLGLPRRNEWQLLTDDGL